MLKIDTIPGCYYIEDYLSQAELDKITNDLLLNNFDFTHITNLNSRRVAHFGFEYNYRSQNLIKTKPIPEYLGDIVSKKRLGEFDIRFNKDFDQLIINEYKKNQKIAPHIDSDNFADGIICLTIIIGKEPDLVPIIFTKCNETHKIFPKSGSLYIMTRESRYEWKHSLINNTNNTRYSFTFRRSKKY